MKELFSIISALVLLIGLILYGRATKNKSAKPNLVTLGIWLLTAMVTTITYVIIVKDYYKSLFMFVALLANVILLAVSIRSKSYVFLKKHIIIGIFGSVVILGISIACSVKDTHLVTQLITTFAYVPMIMGVVKRQGKEPLIPWLMIFLSTIFAIIAIVAEYSDFWSLIHPLRSAAVQIIIIVFILVFRPISQA